MKGKVRGAFFVPIISAIAVGVNLLANTPLNTPILLGILVLAATIQAWVQNRRIADLENTHPNVIVDGFEVEEFQSYNRNYAQKQGYENPEVVITRDFARSTSGDDYGLVHLSMPKGIKVTSSYGAKYVRYYVNFKNVKTEGINLVDTEPLHATLRYYNLDERASFEHAEPFWFDWERGQEIVLKANGKKEGLCIAIRQKDQEELYAFASKQSYPYGFLSPIKEDLRLGTGVINVAVQLSGGNIDVKPIYIELMTTKFDEDEDNFRIDVTCEEIPPPKSLRSADARK